MRTLAVLVGAAVSIGISIVTSSGLAFASNGAIAYDQATGRYGFSWSKPTQQRANELALKDCGSDKCKAIPVPPGQCAALANTDDPKDDNAWGVSVRDQKAAAELAAMQNCQRRTKGQCKVRGSECNR